MSARSLFIILLRVLGLFMIPALIVNLSNLVHTLIAGVFAYEVLSWETLLYYALICAGQLTLIWVMLFKPLMVISKMKLDENFYDEQFSFRMDLDFMVRMACIAAGIYLVASEIPALISLLVQKIIEADAMDTPRAVTNIQLAMSAGRIVVGGLLIGESNRITAFINRRHRKGAASGGE